MVDESHKNPRDLKDERKKIVDMIDKEQLAEGSKNVGNIDEESKDADQTESPWTEEKDAASEIAPIEKAGVSENPVSEDMRKRFSKKHEIDEEELRKNKFKGAKAGGGCK